MDTHSSLADRLAQSLRQQVWREVEPALIDLRAIHRDAMTAWMIVCSAAMQVPACTVRRDGHYATAMPWGA